MEYKLHALSIYEVGQRRDKDGNPHQEDCIYPSKGNVTDKDRLFILCDGMGGHSAGEIASQAVCDAISKTIMEAGDASFTDELFEKALKSAYDLLDKLDNAPESQRKMGTTLTLLKLHKDGATIAHIGDSRVYQIRPSNDGKAQIIFQTRDHSLVNDLIKVGELKPEDAKNYPHKNIITRAMQPHSEERYVADIYHTKHIFPGDYFFMCSDGMLEQMEDDNLCFILNEHKTDEEKIEMLRKVTQKNKDNHSAHLVHIIDVEPKSEIEDAPVIETDDVDEDDMVVVPELDFGGDLSDIRDEESMVVVNRHHRPLQQSDCPYRQKRRVSDKGFIVALIGFVILVIVLLLLFARLPKKFGRMQEIFFREEVVTEPNGIMLPSNNPAKVDGKTGKGTNEGKPDSTRKDTTKVSANPEKIDTASASKVEDDVKIQVGNKVGDVVKSDEDKVKEVVNKKIRNNNYGND